MTIIKTKRPATKLPRLFEIGSDQGFSLKSRTIWGNNLFCENSEFYGAIHGTPTVVDKFCVAVRLIVFGICQDQADQVKK
jgi:hypothetical protein